MNSMIYVIRDEFDIAVMVNMIVLMWYVLLCMLLWLCRISVCGHGMNELHDRQDAQIWYEIHKWKKMNRHEMIYMKDRVI